MHASSSVMDEILPEQIYLRQQYLGSSKLVDQLSSSRHNTSRVNKNSSTDIDRSRQASSRLDSSFQREEVGSLLKSLKPLKARLRYNSMIRNAQLIKERQKSQNNSQLNNSMMSNYTNDKMKIPTDR